MVDDFWGLFSGVRFRFESQITFSKNKVFSGDI